jgi:hypothetical protein
MISVLTYRLYGENGENIIMAKTEIELNELNRQQAIEDMKNLKESVNKTLDTVELSELGLKHNARVYSVNQLITISLMLDNICNALNDVESE